MTRVFIQFLMQSQACLELNGNRDQIEKRGRNDINSKNKKIIKTVSQTVFHLSRLKNSKPIFIILNILLLLLVCFSHLRTFLCVPLTLPIVNS